MLLRFFIIIIILYILSRLNLSLMDSIYKIVVLFSVNLIWIDKCGTYLNILIRILFLDDIILCIILGFWDEKRVLIMYSFIVPFQFKYG